MNVLVINDDGPHSPLLPELLRAVKDRSWCTEVRFVVPSEEQSWIGQAITKFKPIFVTNSVYGDVSGYLATGTPADCASLGIENLFPSKPDLVVSGINFGVNWRLPFYLNSGTIGGASQAFLSGIKSVALSAQIPSDIFQLFRQRDDEALKAYAQDFKRIASAGACVVEKLISADIWAHADFVSANLPWQCTPESEMLVTRLQRAYYEPLFSETEDGCYRHAFAGFRPSDSDDDSSSLPTDVHAVEAGKIALTPIRYALTPQLPSEVKSRLET